MPDKAKIHHEITALKTKFSRYLCMEMYESGMEIKNDTNRTNIYLLSNKFIISLFVAPFIFLNAISRCLCCKSYKESENSPRQETRIAIIEKSTYTLLTLLSSLYISSISSSRILYSNSASLLISLYISSK